MQHYELIIRTARAGTSFYIRADEDDEALRRVVRIASSFDTSEPARLELSCNGRPVACEALAALSSCERSQDDR